MSSDADRISRLERVMEGCAARSTDFERRVGKIEGGLEALGARQSADVNGIRSEIHGLRLDFAKLSTKVLVAATLIAPVLVAALNGVVRKMWG